MLELAKSVGAIAIGAVIGALLRWQLGVRLNALWPALPPGTVVANLIGGYVIGFAIAFFATVPSIAPEWRLMVVTGFCGALTTFSTFSAEVITGLQEGRYGWTMTALAVHLFGSLLMTVAGAASWRLLARI